MSDYGQKISDDKYRSSTIILAVVHSATPKESGSAYRKKQLSLDIDYKLGQDFPVDRREQLWKSVQKHEKYRIGLMIVGGVANIFGLRWFTGKIIQHLVKSIRNAYLKVLSLEDTNAILGPDSETLPLGAVNEKV